MKTKRVAQSGLLVALAMILSYIESLMPVFAAVPGIKLGLTNIVVLVALIGMDGRYAFFINLVRIALVGITFGSLASMVYSLAGGFASFIVMYLLWKSGRFGALGVSTAGGVAHNAGQIAAAMVLLETRQLIYYFPVLFVSGVVSGAVIGLLGGEIAARLSKTQFFREMRG